MREILFWAKRKDNGEWIEGNVLQTDDGDCYIATSCLVGARDEPLMVVAYEVYPETLCQFTGKTDETGKKIYEKDIVGFWEIRSIIKKFWRNFNEPNKFQSIHLRDAERKVRREQEKETEG